MRIVSFVLKVVSPKMIYLYLNCSVEDDIVFVGRNNRVAVVIALGR